MNTDDIPPWHSQVPVESKPVQKPVKYATVQGYLHAGTPKASLFECRQVNGKPLKDPKNVWFPLSRTKSLTRANKPEEYDNIVVQSWLISKNGLV